MATAPHLYRRNQRFWWRRIHTLFSGRKLDIRVSLGTADVREARERSALLTAATRQVIRMLDERMAAPDARPTEDQLRAMATKAYGEKLAQFCDDQRAYPHHADDHAVANQTWADYYERLVRNGGHMPMLPEEDKAWRTMGWDMQRAANLRMAIKHVEDGNPPIARRFVDNHLREHGFEPHNGLRRMVERALYPAYRDACLEAGRRLAAHQNPAAPSPYAASPFASPAVPGTANAMPVDEGSYLSDFVDRAIADRIADETWDNKTGRQARSTIALFELLVGRKKLGAYVQSDLTSFMRKLRFVPKRYDMTSSRSREEVLAAVALRETAARVDTNGVGEGDLSNRTRNRHLSSLIQIVRWGKDNGMGTPAISFDGVWIPVSKRKRARAERAPTPAKDVAALFALPIWTGCQPHGGGNGLRVLKARFAPGEAIIQDAFYWVPLLLYYTGARRGEICKLRPEDVLLDPLPHIHIDFTEFGRIKNDQSVRPVPLHPELLRLGFVEFVAECRSRGYDVLFPELRPTNSVQDFGDVYFKTVWRNLKRAGRLTGDATNHGMRHRFSTELKTREVFSEFRRDLMGHGGLDINEERYSDIGPMMKLADTVGELPSVTDVLRTVEPVLPRRAVRRPRPAMKRARN